MADTDVLLNVASLCPRTRTNGPGWRAAIWVQGCTIRCPGCFNPHTHPHEPRHLWEPERLAEHLMAPSRMDPPRVEGITILGGEPFEQAAACARLARAAHRRGGSVVTYSGYTWSWLRGCGEPAVHELITASDLLIAGPFIRALETDGRGWRGSANQEFLFLTERYDASALRDDESPRVEVWLDGLTARWSGIPGATSIPSLCSPEESLGEEDESTRIHHEDFVGLISNKPKRIRDRR